MKVEIKPKETALVLVDMQNDLIKGPRKTLVEMVNQDGIIGNISKVIESARGVDVPVFLVKTMYRKDGSDRVAATTDRSLKAPPSTGPSLLIEGTPGSEIIDEIEPQPGDYIINKRRLNSFYNTDLELLLRSRGVKTIILAGVVTNACIDATLKGARERDFNVIIPVDSTACGSREIQDFYTKKIFPGASVTMTTSETVEALRKTS
jgi:nicotinamidase-related amidase